MFYFSQIVRLLYICVFVLNKTKWSVKYFPLVKLNLCTLCALKVVCQCMTVIFLVLLAIIFLPASQ